MRLSFEHSNPVVFWAIAINTSVGPWLKGCILLLDPGYFKYLFFDRIVRYGGYFVNRLIFKELRSHYRMDQIPSANPETVKCLIWIAILALMCSRRILRLIRNANPENADRYTHLRWAKVFTEQADRLLTEVLECVGLKLEPICSLYTTFTSVRDAIQMSSERG